MNQSKIELRTCIIRLSQSLSSDKHTGEGDMIVARILQRCNEYFDLNTIEGIEAEKMLEANEEKYRELFD